jgi:hypothetical protein
MFALIFMRSRDRRPAANRHPASDEIRNLTAMILPILLPLAQGPD